MPRKLLFALAALVLVAGGVAAAIISRMTDRPSSGLDTALEGVSVSTAPTEVGTLPTTTAKPRKKKKPEKRERCWTEFGGDPQRTLALPEITLGKPTKALWARGYRDTMEYPPTFCDGTLYLNLQKTGRTLAVDAATGRKLWSRDGAFKASSPAIAGPRLIVSSHDGTVTAFLRANGRTLWQVRTAGKVESSPVVVGNTTYFGSTDGRLFAVDVRTGRIRWAYNTGGRINSSPSVWGGRVCISTYAGSVFCVRARNGTKLWSTYVKRDLLRYESFYASPSTDGARVYTVARTGKVVALRARDGKVVWTQHMHALGYTTPAIAHGRIFVGAYDRRFRAYKATNGNLLWSRAVDGRIAGPALVVGNLVFFSTFEGMTFAARVGDGRIVWRFRGGQYAPGIATDRMYYFSFNGLLIAFRAERSPRRMAVT